MKDKANIVIAADAGDGAGDLRGRFEEECCKSERGRNTYVLKWPVRKAARNGEWDLRMVTGHELWNWSGRLCMELAEMVRQAAGGGAAALPARVAVATSNWNVSTLVILALVRSNVRFSLWNPKNNAEGFANLISKCQTEYVIVDSCEEASAAAPGELSGVVARIRAGAELAKRKSGGSGIAFECRVVEIPASHEYYTRLLDESESAAAAADLTWSAEGDGVWGIHSSGSTGLPKPLWLSTAALCAHIRPPAPDCSFYMVAPLFHLLGILSGLLPLISAQYTLTAHLTDSFPIKPSAIAQTIIAGKVTNLVALPIYLDALCRFVAHNPDHKAALSQLKEVGYGGAHLPAHTKAALLQFNPDVKVFTGYGSSEGGYTMRTYTDLPEGQPLRTELMVCTDPEGCIFHPVGDADAQGNPIYRMIIKKYRLLCPDAANCDEGHDTNDLFVKGPYPNTWELRGRQDDTLVHANGEKTHAADVESRLQNAAGSIVNCVQVFGTGRETVSAIVELNWEELRRLNCSLDDARARLADATKVVNQKVLPHSRIFPEYVHILPESERPSSEPAADDDPRRLAVTIKGNLRRQVNEKKFAGVVRELYEPAGADAAPRAARAPATGTVKSLREAVQLIIDGVNAVAENKFAADDPELETLTFESMGLDSQSTLRLTRLLNERGFSWLRSVDIFEHQSVLSLADFIFAQAGGGSDSAATSGRSRAEATQQFMKQQVPASINEIHKTLDAWRAVGQTVVCPSPRHGAPGTRKRRLTSARRNRARKRAAAASAEKNGGETLEVLPAAEISGAAAEPEGRSPGTEASAVEGSTARVFLITGASGALGNQLLLSLLQEPVSSVKQIFCAYRGGDREKLLSSFRSRGVKDLDEVEAALASGRLQTLNYVMDRVDCGWGSRIYRKLSSEVTDIVANAWKMDFNLPPQAFVHDCLTGLQNLIQLALLNRRKSVGFVSSISSAARWAVRETGEDQYFIPESVSDDPGHALPMGYAQSKWIAENLLNKAAEEFNLRTNIFRCGQLCGDTKYGAWNASERVSLILIGSVTDLKAFPKDYGGGDRVDLLPMDIAGRAIVEIGLRAREAESAAFRGAQVFNLANPSGSSWADIGRYVASHFPGVKLVDIGDFQKIVKSKPESKLNLLDAFHERLAEEAMAAADGDSTVASAPASPLATRNSCANSPTLRNCPQITDDLLSKFFGHWKNQGLIVGARRADDEPVSSDGPSN